MQVTVEPLLRPNLQVTLQRSLPLGRLSNYYEAVLPVGSPGHSSQLI